MNLNELFIQGGLYNLNSSEAERRKKIMELKALSVEISRPPPRQKGQQAGPSLGAGATGAPPGSRGKGRSQLSFVPRAVASSSSNGNGSSSAPKSNADFRSMLLKK